ncbi:PREDICTED: leucine-rich repeat-containing protein 15, partial [Phaethon lepturus]|uniref:leucine-rich repeat-containing protein 15 n=1 Tax=Phaethon lepturus TaxID=97097 RepID=UPI000530AFA9
MCSEETPSSAPWFRSVCDRWLQGGSSGILCLTLRSIGRVSSRPLTSTSRLGKLIQQPWYQSTAFPRDDGIAGRICSQRHLRDKAGVASAYSLSKTNGEGRQWLLLLVGIQLASGQCPEQCQCVRTAQVECSGAGITEVPSPIPANAMTLQIINTRITELGDASFGNASLLIGLRIEKNNLSRISPGAFQHLPDLRYLSLASNKLQELPVQVFEPLDKLESLLLSSNQILQ